MLTLCAIASGVLETTISWSSRSPQNNIAMNCPQLVQPRACRSAWCCFTAFSNPSRENNQHLRENAAYFHWAESPVVELVLRRNPIQPIRGLSLVPATTPSDSAKSQPADLDSGDLVEEGMDQLELQHIVGRQP
jgi:hypothetical protein